MNKDGNQNINTEEFLAFCRNIGQGYATFKDIGDVSTGVTPKEIIHKHNKMVLYRYHNGPIKKPSGIPVLIVYALVNRPYVADLQEDRSLIQNLLNRGLDVYLIDWGYPDISDRCLTLDDYVNGYIEVCVSEICTRRKLTNINLLGICQGGTLSLCYAAIHPEKVRNLITMVTPVDFHTKDNLLSNWVRHLDIDMMVDTLGNIPGEMLTWIFLALKPYSLMGQKYIDMVDSLDDKDRTGNFMRMEKWIFDNPDQAGEAFREFLKEFFQRNGLINGGVNIGSVVAKLSNITMPVLNIYARDDHLVPPSSSKPLGKLVGTEDYSEWEFKGGHIGIYVSASAQRDVPQTIDEWLTERN